MARTNLNQSTQADASLTNTAVDPAENTFSSDASTAHEHLKALEMQISRLLDAAQSSGNWLDNGLTVELLHQDGALRAGPFYYDFNSGDNAVEE